MDDYSAVLYDSMTLKQLAYFVSDSIIVKRPKVSLEQNRGEEIRLNIMGDYSGDYVQFRIT